MVRTTLAAIGALLLTLSAGTATASEFWDEVKTPGLREWGKLVRSARAIITSGPDRDNESSLALLDAAIQLVPTRAAAHVLRARVLWDLNQRSEAIKSIRKALELDATALDDDTEGSIAAATAAHVGEMELAAQILERVVARMRPSQMRTELYILYGDVLLSLGQDRLRESILAFREAIRNTPRPPTRASLGLALALLRQGSRDEAIAQLVGIPMGGSIQRILTVIPVPQSERNARQALFLEHQGRTEDASTQWLGAASGPWAAHAEQQAERLAGSPRRGTTRRRP